MITNDSDIQQITEVVNWYFTGSYHGDVEQIKRAFHPEAHITGCINDQVYDWTLTDFITRVTTTPTSAQKNEPYDKKILFIDKTIDAAMVKAQVVVAGLVFTDYITLLKINEQWCIRNKSFTATKI